MVQGQLFIECRQVRVLRSDHFIPLRARLAGIEAFYRLLFRRGQSFSFACLHQQMLMRSGLVGKQEHATGAEVGIGLIQIILIIRSEVIGHFEAI